MLLNLDQTNIKQKLFQVFECFSVSGLWVLPFSSHLGNASGQLFCVAKSNCNVFGITQLCATDLPGAEKYRKGDWKMGAWLIISGKLQQ